MHHDDRSEWQNSPKSLARRGPGNFPLDRAARVCMCVGESFAPRHAGQRVPSLRQALICGCEELSRAGRERARILSADTGSTLMACASTFVSILAVSGQTTTHTMQTGDKITILPVRRCAMCDKRFWFDSLFFENKCFSYRLERGACRTIFKFRSRVNEDCKIL